MFGNQDLSNQIFTVLELRSEFTKLSFLIHSIKKESKKYDEVYHTREDIRKKLNSMGFNPKVTDNMTKLNILVYMYEHPFSKVTHDLFDVNEYIYYDDNTDCIRDEHNNIFETWDENSSYNGFMMRTSEHWENNWRLYKE